MYVIIQDWQDLVNNKITPSDFCNKYWEEFKPIYCSITRNIDDGDLYIQLHDIVTKMFRHDISPQFTTRGEIFAYIKRGIYNNWLQSQQLQSKLVSLEEVMEKTDIPSTSASPLNKIEDEYDYAHCLEHLSSKLTDSQLQIVMLLSKGYSRTKISEMLGISVSNLNFKVYEIRNSIDIKDILGD